MKRLKRLRPVIAVGLLLLSLTPALPLGAQAAAGHAGAREVAPPEHTVLVGLGQLEVSQGSALSNTPKYLDVTVGDTVLFRDVDALEPHTVSFGPMALLKDLAGKDQFVPIPQKGGPPILAFNPKVAFPTPATSYAGMGFANSGILMKGQSWRLTFTHPGTYEYICLIHGVGMNGYVIVHPAQPQHATLYHVQAGDGLQAVNDRSNTTTNDAFYPFRLTIHAGDTVQWVGGFHTISFGPPALIARLEKSLIVPMPQKSGPPRLALNPKITYPSGGTKYDGTGFVNSGVLALQVPPGSTATPSYKLTFTRPGTYTYYCLIHPGMDATITVLP